MKKPIENKRKEVCDEEIVAKFWERDEAAIAATKEKYESYLMTVAGNILKDRRDCEECVNDTYLGVWNAIPPERPRAFRAFLTTVIRRKAINRYHHNARKKSVPSEMTVALCELDEVLAFDGGMDGSADTEQLSEWINAFVHGLDQRRRYIFLNRYYLALPIETIAGELGISRSTVNKEIAAIKRGLKEKLESEGYHI